MLPKDLLVKPLLRKSYSLPSRGGGVFTEVKGPLKEGALDTFVRLLNTPGVVALLAARALSLLADTPEAQTLITKSSPSVLSRLFMTFRMKDNEMQKIILTTLETLSFSSEELRHRIIQEEQGAGRPILSLLKPGCEQNDQILLNAVNLVGNLAISASDQGILQPYLTGLVRLLENPVEDRVELLISIARGLANFADFEINSLVLTNQLPTIIDNLTRPEVELLKLHTCRLVTNLLTYETSYTSEMLIMHGGVLYLQTLFLLPNMRDLVNNCIIRTAPRLSQHRTDKA
ncbi:uncharacterized protein LOC106458123 [Limulus polyphemus]|uniref:Uncharacterized protein LOC106458123 n=1 Tax=Limulus polyphemus TaxID=6850 RepID=A0ABM1S956_LIMPO|nr:uncharacterized protein LOC106458123 [Limulus polyphemus]